MADYPQLTKMGINNPHEIEKFMVNGIADYDVLRIIYQREEFSLLPTSRTYKFYRVPRELASGDSNGTTTVMETNPDLRAAVAELRVLLDGSTKKATTKKELLEQIKLLEEDMALRSKYIRELAESL